MQLPPGSVLQEDEDDVFVKCMHDMGDNKFHWSQIDGDNYTVPHYMAHTTNLYYYFFYLAANAFCG